MKTTRLTIKQAKEILSPLSISISKKSTGEYRVNYFPNGSENSAYYTDDINDAVATGEAMAALQAEKI